ncbi:pentapeptide repeat-containing protein [Moorena sp. SIO3I8]
MSCGNGHTKVYCQVWLNQAGRLIVCRLTGCRLTGCRLTGCRLTG